MTIYVKDEVFILGFKEELSTTKPAKGAVQTGHKGA